MITKFNISPENCGVAEITVLRTRNTKGESRVHWHTEDITAIADKDYEGVEVSNPAIVKASILNENEKTPKGEIIFPNGAMEARIRIRIIDNDEFDDSGRAFRIVLTSPSNGTKLGQHVATISIIEDDGEAVTCNNLKKITNKLTFQSLVFSNLQRLILS